MSRVTAHLTNKACGYPTRGAARRVKAPILACIHITGNRRTAANPDRHQAARDERNYANRSRLQWSVRPLLRRPRRLGDRGHRPGQVRRLVERRRREPEHSERWHREGARPAREGLQPQRGVLARDRMCRLRLDLPDHQGAAAVHCHPDRRDGQGDGLPVNRNTVHGHSDLNSVNRASCPCPKASREAVLGDVIARANAILRPPIVTVTVKAGDTLSEIAAAHRLTLKALLAFPENARYSRQPRAHPPRRDRPREVIGGAMDSPPGTVWGREPAMVLALVQAVIALVVAFGLPRA